MSTTTYLVTTPWSGGTEGTSFNDHIPVADISTAAINKVVVRSDSYINRLEVYYSQNKGVGTPHGGDGGTRHELALEFDEFIARVEGRAEGSWMRQLKFTTNKREWGPFGKAVGKYFSWGSTDEDYSLKAPHARLLSFAGSANSYISGLQANFTEYREHNLKSVIYESKPTAAQDNSPPFCISKFTLHLMSPIVTLLVGQSGQEVEFNVYEDTLCQLPFFKGALLGGFKEAVQKTINLPEDNPNTISSLIEYLYTGNYTYTYDSTTAQFQGGSNTPAGDLAEGLFHVGVYAVATKYICPGLAKIAVKNLMVVLDELGNIGKLRLWKAAYDEGIYLQGRKNDFQQYHSGKGLAEWVSGLFGEHREEMETTIFDYPMLARDLLRITTGP